MPFDTMTLAAVADEITASLRGGRVQKVIQPSPASIALSMYGLGESRWLLLSTDAVSARVHLSELKLAKAFATPSSFVMLLRKHLEGSHLVDVRQTEGERILHLFFRRGEITTRLVAEIMGRRSNLILTDDGDKILGAFKIITPRQSRVRSILPGHALTPPPKLERDTALFPPGERFHPPGNEHELRALLLALPGATLVSRALLGCFKGMSPFLAQQVVLRAISAPDASLENINVDRLLVALSELYGLYSTRAWKPCKFEGLRGCLDFAPYIPGGVTEILPTGSISVAIEESLGQAESQDPLRTLRRSLVHDIGKQQAAARGKLAALQQGLAASQQAETVKTWGQLLLAYKHAVEAGDSELALTDLDVTIPLDARLSAQENAERYFRRYRKLQEAARRLPGLIRATEARQGQLQDAVVFAELATTEKELAAVREALVPSTPASPPQKTAKPKPPAARYSYQDATALVGRNARENEHLTFQVARRGDLWFHARERTGAHVILQTPESPPPEEVLAAAAGLAAHFSEARHDTAVDVEYTAVSNVRKIPGGAVGRVTYRGSKTVRVKPSVKPWTLVGRRP